MKELEAAPQPITSLSALVGINVGSVRMQWTVPETLADGSTIYIHYSTNATTNWSAGSAQIVSTLPAVTIYDTLITTAGGLDVGVDGSNANISPTYYFRVFVSTELNSYSSESNGSTRTAALPGTLPVHTFTNYAAADGWLSQTTGNGSANDVANGIGRDAAGNVYVGGVLRFGTTDIYVRKYDPAGAIQWTKFYNAHPNTSIDEGIDADVDDAGNVYVAGTVSGYPSYQGDNGILRKYDTNGLLLWTTDYNSPGNEDDEFFGVAADANGNNVYITGYEERGGIGQGRNLLVRKYDGNGILQWTTTYNSPDNSTDQGNAIEVDSSGNVYVAGHESRTGQNNNILVRKYDPNGLLLWTTTYNSPSSDNDIGFGIAVDAAGNPHVTGRETRPGQGANLWVRKYTTSGSVVWTSTYSAPSGFDDIGDDIALDAAGNVYVSGVENRLDTGQGDNALLYKYDANGLIVWTTSYQLVTDRGFGVVVDNSNNVYMSGRNGNTGAFDAFVRKYVQNAPNAPTSLAGVAQSSNSILWTWVDVSTGYQYAEEGTAVVRSTDNVVLTSYTAITAAASSYLQRNLTPNASSTIFLRAFNVVGQSVTANSGVMYSSANIPATAGSTFPFASDSMITAQWLANGNPNWTQYIVDISTWNGFTGTVTSSTTFLTSVSTAGLAEASTYYFRVTARNGNGFDTPYLDLGYMVTPDVLQPISSLSALAGINVGSVRLQWTVPETLANGSTIYIHYSTSANTSWSAANAQIVSTIPAVSQYQQFITTAGGLDVGVNGSNADISPTYFFRVFIGTAPNSHSAESNGSTRTAALPTLPTNSFTNYGATDGWYANMDGSGGGNDSASGIARDGSGNIYVSGWLIENGGTDGFLRKYDSAGAIQWTKFSNSHANAGDFPVKLAVDNSGNVYVAGGEISYLTYQDFNAVLRKYDTNGLLLWTTTYNSPNNNSDEYTSIALDVTENSIYAAGYENRSDLGQGRNLMLKKFDSSGLLQWSTTYNNPDNLNDYLVDVAVDGSGNVFVGGYEARTGQGENHLLRKYDSSGLLLWTTTYNAANGDERARGIAADSSGNVFVAGSETVGTSNILVRKYGSSGLLLWTTSFNLGNDDQGLSVAVDGIGNGYVAGYEDRTDIGQTKNGFIRKFDPNGLIVWTTSYDNGNWDQISKIILDNTGNIFVSGQNGANSVTTAFVRKFVQNVPNAPTGLAGVAQSSSSILWTWVDVSTGYQYAEEGTAIVRSTDNVVLSSYTVINAGTSSYLQAGLTPNASSTIFLRAFNVVGQSVTANSSVIYSSANIPLTAVSTYTVSDSAITAQWLANNNPSWTQYVVDIATGANFVGTMSSSITYLTSVSTSGLADASTYYIRVKARNGSGFDTPYLDLGYATTLDILQPITSLSALAGINVGSVRLQWTVPETLADGSTVYIHYSTSANTGWSAGSAQLVSTIPAVTQFQTFVTTAGGLDVGVNGSNADISPTYFFRVFMSTALNSFSAESNGSTRTARLPTLPTNSLTNYGADNGWRARLLGSDSGGDQGKGVDVDGSGNVYAAGTVDQNGGSDAFVRKYDSSGNIQWTKYFNGTLNRNEEGMDVAVDAAGNSYISGTQAGPVSNDMILRKYDANGLLLWSTAYASAGNLLDEGQGVAVDDGGTSVLLAGFENRADLGQSNNLVLRKYDGNGLLQWTTTYNNPDNGSDSAQAVQIDGSGNVYVTGGESRTGEGLNVLTRKYDASGALLWHRTYNGIDSNWDTGHGIEVDSSGNVYVVGRTQEGGNNNVWLRKYDSSGLVLWTTTYNSPTNNDDRGVGSALDSAGNFYVTGNEDRNDVGQTWNALVRKYNSNGLLVWATSYHENFDAGEDLIVDNSGNVYLTGYDGTFGTSDVFVRKFVQNRPNAPASFIGVAQSSSSILWTWVDVSTGPQYQEEGLRIVRSTDGVVLSTYGFMSTGASSYLMTGLSPNTSATLYLQAYNVAGASNTAPLIAYSSANAPLTASSTFTFIGITSVTFQWLPNSNPSWTQYVAEISTWAGFSGTVSSSSTFLTSVTTTGLTAVSTYYFRVKARNGSGSDTAFTALGSTATFLDIASPQKVTDIQAQLTTDIGVVRLTWTSPGEDGTTGTPSLFMIRMATAPEISPALSLSHFASAQNVDSTSPVPVPLAGGTSVQFMLVTGLMSNTSYFFAIRAVDDVGNFGPLSNGATVFNSVRFPGAISDLTALSGPGEGEIALNWTSPGDAGVQGNINGGLFRIRYSTNPIPDFDNPTAPYTNIDISTSVTPLTQQGYVVAGLNPGTTYHFAILTRNDSFFSTWSVVGVNTANFAPARDAAPTPPSSVNINYSTETAVKLEWSLPGAGAVDDRSQYKIYRATFVFSNGSQGNVNVAGTVAHPTSFYIDSPLTAGETYFYRIASIDQGDQGSGLYSIPLEGSLSPVASTATLFRAPSQLLGTVLSSQTVVWSWLDLSQAESGFRVYSSTNGVLSGDLPANTTFWVESNLVPNTSYTRYARAFNAVTLSSASNFASTRTYAAIPSTPTLVQNGTAISLDFDIAVDSNPAGTEYALAVSTDGFAVNTYYASYPGGGLNGFEAWQTTSAWEQNVPRLTGLVSGTTYYLKLKARNGDLVQTAFGGTASTFTITGDDIVPDNISDLAATPGSIDGQVNLSWTAPGDDLSSLPLNNGVFRIHWSTSPFTLMLSTDVSSHQVDTNGIAPGTVVNYSTNGLNPGTTYYFGVITRDDSGNWSHWAKTGGFNTSNFTWALDLPLAAPIPSITSRGESTIGISWVLPSSPTYVDDRDLYRIYRATYNFSTPDDVVVTLSSTVNHPISNFTDTGLTIFTTYFYRIVAVDQGDRGEGLYSTALESAISAIVSTVTQVTAPSNLVAFSATTSTLHWEWRDNATAETGFVVVTTNSVAVSPTLNPGTTFWEETGLSPNVSYTRRVQALTIGGGAFESTATAKYTLASAPAALPFKSITDQSLTAEWSPEGNPFGTQHTMELALSASFAPALQSFTFTTTNKNLFGIAALTSNTTYWVRVKAINEEGYSSNWTLLGSTVTLAAAPSNLVLSNPSTSTIQILLEEGDNPSYTEFLIAVSADAFASSSYVQADGTAGSTESWNTLAGWSGGTITVTGLTPSLTYSFRTRARNSLGLNTSFNSSESTPTLAVAPGAPTLTPSFDAILGNHLRVAINSGGNSNQAQYAIEYVEGGTYLQGDGRAGSSPVWYTASQWSAAGSSNTHAGLIGNTTYSYRVSARNPSGIAAGPSATASAVMPQLGDVVAPSISSVSPTDGSPSAGTGDSIRIVLNEDIIGVSAAGKITMTAVMDNMARSISQNVSGSISASTTTIMFTPASALQSGYTYQVTVASGIQDLAGNIATWIHTWTFKTRYDPGATNVVYLSSSGFRLVMAPNAFSEAYGTAILNAWSSSVEVSPAIVQSAVAKKRASGLPTYMPAGGACEINNYAADGRRLRTPQNTVTLTFSYNDADQDGLVDDLSPPINERDMSIYVLNEDSQDFVRLPNSVVDAENNTVTADLPHFSVFAAMGSIATTMIHAHAYPVPFVPAHGDANITFTDLSQRATIRIYTASGELVQKLEETDGDGQYVWDVRTSGGAEVASGVYIYKIIGPAGEKSGKLVIVR